MVPIHVVGDSYCYRARSHDAAIGSFTSEDPEFAFNLYHYGSNDPASSTDPTGRTNLNEQSSVISAEGSYNARAVPTFSRVLSRRFVATPRGTLFEVPKGWVARPASNGKGIVYQRPGATGNADSIRIMEPTARYPNGYFRFYNSKGQPLGPNGKPGPQNVTHIPENYSQPIMGWPIG